MNNKEVLIFIDDSGKLYDKNNFTIYTATIFFNSNNLYKLFAIDFWNILKEINNGIELKGTDFWTKEITWKSKIKILSLLKKHNINNVIHVFSFILNKKNLNYKFIDDNQSESILNKSIAILCDNISSKLNLNNCNFILKIDEQVRNYYNSKHNNSINSYLNYHKPKLLAIQNLRDKNINFKTDDKHISSECPGVMIADILANAINRMHNKYSKNKKEILDFIEKHTNINLEENFFIWPLCKTLYKK